MVRNKLRTHHFSIHVCQKLLPIVMSNFLERLKLNPMGNAFPLAVMFHLGSWQSLLLLCRSSGKQKYLQINITVVEENKE